MKLLNINTPSYTRVQYANLECQEKWQNKINVGSKLYPSLEFLTVKHDVRKCMIIHDLDPNNLEVTMRNLSKQGLYLTPLAKEGSKSGNGFGHVSSGYNGGDYVYRAVIGKSIQDVEEFAHAHNTGDDIKIGELLGFPKKSSEFFDTNWKKGYFDPIWQQADNTNGDMLKNKRDFLDKDGNVEKKLIRFKYNKDSHKISSVFRYVGIRVTSHFSSSFDEQESIEVADNWIQLAKDLRLRGLNEALEILQLPYEWDCYKGVAIVNTPVMKIVTSSMPCYPNHVIQQESDYYPEESPNGIVFPWKIKTSCKD